MLENLITSKTRLRLLIKFFISQANKGHLNGLASEMGESTNSIRKELNHLFEAGYLNKTKNYTKTCKEFNCSRISLMRWVRKYKKDKTIKRYNRKPISYKITKNQVDYALKILDKNQQITMKELHKQVKKKYPKLDISVRQLNNIIRDNN